MEENRQNNYIGYEYLEVNPRGEHASMLLDGYLSFGWTADDNMSQTATRVRLKRDRRTMNRAELTRLQRHFEACMAEVRAMERSTTSTATMVSIVIGLVGTAFMAGAVFAVTASPPVYWLMALLAVPGFIGWALPTVAFKMMARRTAKKLEPLIEAKYDEMYEICEKGNRLINE